MHLSVALGVGTGADAHSEMIHENTKAGKQTSYEQQTLELVFAMRGWFRASERQTKNWFAEEEGTAD